MWSKRWFRPPSWHVQMVYLLSVERALLMAESILPVKLS
jgi:hypothetical protein